MAVTPAPVKVRGQAPTVVAPSTPPPDAPVVVRPALAADRVAWDAFVAARPEGDPLQVWTWGEVVATGGERPVRVLAERGGVIVGVVQALVRPAKFGRCVLYAPHGPVWCRDDPGGEAVLPRLLEALLAVGRDERAIVVKVDPRGDDESGADAADLGARLGRLGLRTARFDLQARSTRVVELLDGGPRLMATWHPKARRQVRRAGRAGVIVAVDRTGDPEATTAFYGVLVDTARRCGFRVRTLDFLKALAAAFSAADSWYLALAWRAGRPIAGIAAPRVGDRAFCLYGASLREPGLAASFGSDAAMAELMRVLAADSVAWLDLWGVAESDDPTADPSWLGFSYFKRTFGGRPVRHPGTFDLVVDPVWYRLRDGRERLLAATRQRPA